MRKINVLVILVLLLGVNFVFAQNNFVDAVNLKASLVNQEPDPVDPGSYVDVKFRVENLGTTPAEGVVIELLPEYPFSLRPGDSAVQNLNSLGGVQTEEDGVIVKYRLKVDSAAVQGDNDLKLRFKHSKGSWIQPSEFKISVRSSSAVVDIASVTSSPSSIVPGESAKVTFELKNAEDGMIKDVTVSLDLSGTSIPLVPVGSTAEKKIKFIDGGSSESIVMELSALSNAEAGIYKVPVTVSYKDASGTLFTRSGVIGLTIGSKPDLVVLVESSEITKVGTSGKLNLKFTNKGLSGIKFLNVNIKETADFKMISSPEVYVGKIDSDDYETAEFSLYVLNANDGNVVIPVELEYRDANNKLFTETRNVDLRVFSSSEAKMLGINGSKSSFGPVLTVLIVALGLGIYFWRRNKKK